MCGRYALDADIDILIERYKAIIADTNFNRKSEIFPTDTVPVVRQMEDTKIDYLKWGFTPSYAKGPLINARAETIDVKSSFRDSFINRRCLIPATSFFEWEKIDGKKLRRSISISEDNIFSLAGLYNTFFNKEGKKFEAFTIITTSANDSMKHIHDRMPVIIPRSLEEKWLDKENRNLVELKKILLPWKSNMIID